jgi:hypothetical protein
MVTELGKSLTVFIVPTVLISSFPLSPPPSPNLFFGKRGVFENQKVGKRGGLERVGGE